MEIVLSSVLIVETVILGGFTFYTLYYKKEATEFNLVKEHATIISNDVKEQLNPALNKRKCFRVDVDHIFCIMKLINFGDDKLAHLEGKMIEGHIENISLTGIKVASNIELPVRSDIQVSVSFKFDEYVFEIKGKVIRREDHLENRNVSYGIEFINLLPNQQRHLYTILNKKNSNNKIIA